MWAPMYCGVGQSSGKGSLDVGWDNCGQYPPVKIIVLSAEPESTRSSDTAYGVLETLGCRLSVFPVDVDAEQLVSQLPNLIVVDEPQDQQTTAIACRYLGANKDLREIPVLVTIAVDKLSALEFSWGFDDFLLSPIVPAELYARVRKLDWKTAVFEDEHRIKISDLLIDVAGHEVTVAGRGVALTHQEFALLRFLAENQGRVFSRDALLQRVWGYAYGGGSRTVDIHVRRLRAKLGPYGRVIHTVRNVGYKLTAKGAL